MKFKKVFLFVTLFFMTTALFLWKLSRNPNYQVFGKIYSRFNVNKKLVSLTFDDGPNPNNTENILGVLETYHVPATFFVVGKNLELYPEIARKVVNRGHQIAHF